MERKQIEKLLAEEPAPFGGEAGDLIRALVVEAQEQEKRQKNTPALPALRNLVPILATRGELRWRVLKTAYRLLARVAWPAYGDLHYAAPYTALRDLILRLLKGGQPPEEADFKSILEVIAQCPAHHSDIKEFRLEAVLKAVEARVDATGLGAVLRASLERLLAAMCSLAEKKRVQYGEIMKCEPPPWNLFTFLSVPDRRIVERIDAILEQRHREYLSGQGTWERSARAWLSKQPKAERAKWETLIAHAATGAIQKHPSAKWRALAASHVRAIGARPFSSRLIDWLEEFDLEATWSREVQAILRGLILAASATNVVGSADAIGRFAERCYKKIPGIGPGSIKLGNASMIALAGMPGLRGAAQLARLKQRVRYTAGVQTLGESLEQAASRSGLTVDTLEERVVPDFELSDGKRSVKIADLVAEIDAREARAAIGWRKSDGTPLRALPVKYRRSHEARLKALKRLIKDIDDALIAQRLRIESTWLSGRNWTLADWRRYYLDHPLVGVLARRLIWIFESGGESRPGLFVRGAVRDPCGAEIALAGDDLRVRLWHPIAATAVAVLAWRRAIEALEIVQPFKQAHREIYILTDAERETGDYSNRFAAHILRQHQLTKLFAQRGWKYSLQGAWDSHNIPTRSIEPLGLDAQFWVEPILSEARPGSDSEAAMEGEGYSGFALVTSDRVRFCAPGNRARRLSEIPPIAFSELMRDVDLFVSVCSVGNDPTWADGGPEGRFRDYWNRYAFGPLNETAKTRRAALESLVPRLKIAAQCSLGERDLIVRGRLRTYKIHLGSANIRMEPNDQYLCIVPARGKEGAGKGIRLPFEGDQTLALILSKAFLLVEDDKIRDPTILSQIRGAAAA